MSFIGRTTILRPDGVTPLSDKDIRRVAPSAFTGEAHESGSARHAYFSTADVIRGMRDAGFLPMVAGQARTRDLRRALEAAKAWQGVSLNREEQRALGDAARVLRFGNAEGRTETPITAEQLLGRGGWTTRATTSGAPSTGCRRTPSAAG